MRSARSSVDQDREYQYFKGPVVGVCASRQSSVREFRQGYDCCRACPLRRLQYPPGPAWRLGVPAAAFLSTCSCRLQHWQAAHEPREYQLVSMRRRLARQWTADIPRVSRVALESSNENRGRRAAVANSADVTGSTFGMEASRPAATPSSAIATAKSYQLATPASE